MKISIRKDLPRLPLEGSIDLTYRCNNICRHCWLWLALGASEGQEELSLAEIRRIVDEARGMGCNSWGISGGEPMLRPDFPEIFDYITRKSVVYRLNTNGTLITPEIAHLLRRKGRKMVALYGATAEVHDQVTRNPGSFEAVMRGFAYLKEAGAGFEVQIIPMRANYHQYSEMLALGESLSPHYRIGASWLFLSACGSAVRNHEIECQRLNPSEVLVLDPPVPDTRAVETIESPKTTSPVACDAIPQVDDHLFARCIASRRDFHIDPYGGVSFCYFVKDPALRFDLRKGSFQQAWEKFIPGLANIVRGGQEYLENCGSCNLRSDCSWCGVYGFLEHRRFSAKVEYLCQVAQQTRQFKENWKLDHLRHYQIAGITIQVASDFPITENTFAPKFGAFRVDGPGEDNIYLRLKSPIPPPSELNLGTEIYRNPPWAIYQGHRGVVYLGISSDESSVDPWSMAIFETDHSQGTIYRKQEIYEKGGLGALTSLPTDQILLARILADRQGCYLHASGIVMDGQGLLFVGHSGAGKSTTLKMLRGSGEILCDDRVILRRWTEGFKIHGTWSHGELPDVSPTSAPLRALLFLEKANVNELIPIVDKKERFHRVLAYVVKPLVDASWWEKILPLAERIAAEVPIYRLRFDKSGQLREVLQAFLKE